jgi:RNA polymerase sigma factor (TIGR02999 family)
MSPDQPTLTQEPKPSGNISNAMRFAALYRELRQLAERQLRRDGIARISPTTLLHEAYLGMFDKSAVFPDRERFIGYAARVMRSLIIDMVRERRALKRGGAFHITHLPTEINVLPSDEGSLARLSDSLDELAVVDPMLAELVDLKYFCGYTFDDIAAQRGTSTRTVKREWDKARALLFDKMTKVT